LLKSLKSIKIALPLHGIFTFIIKIIYFKSIMKKSIFLTVAALVMGFTAFTGCTSNNADAPKTREERIAATQEAIKNSPEWLETVKKKAEERHLPLDSMILRDAIWMADEEDGKHKEVPAPAAPAADAAKPAADPKAAPAEAAKPAAPAPGTH
jgi:hypothetical protein